MQCSQITYHDLLVTMQLSNFILGVINKALDDKNEPYYCAHVGAQGHERHSVHCVMHKIPASCCVVMLFYAENYDRNANDGTDAIILPKIRAWLP